MLQKLWNNDSSIDRVSRLYIASFYRTVSAKIPYTCCYRIRDFLIDLLNMFAVFFLRNLLLLCTTSEFAASLKFSVIFPLAHKLVIIACGRKRKRMRDLFGYSIVELSTFFAVAVGVFARKSFNFFWYSVKHSFSLLFNVVPDL